MRRCSRASSWLALAALACSLAARPAIAQDDASAPVAVDAVGLFGPELHLPARHIPVRVTVRNRTAAPLRGRVIVESSDWRERSERHGVALDLPPRGERTVELTVLARESGTLVAGFELGGRRVASRHLSIAYNAAAEGLVVLADPPRIRGSLLDVQTEQFVRHGGTSIVNMPVGVISFDATSGEPLAPTRASGWHAARLVVASAPTLERLSPTQRDALFDWLRGGGELVVFLRSPEDLRAPAMQAMAPLTWRPDDDPTPSALVPAGAPAARIVASTDRAEPREYGISVPVGFGRVEVVRYDGTAPPYVDAPETRRLVEQIAGRPRRAGAELPMFRPGAPESFDDWSGGWTFRPVRSYLDPNESFRPALGFVAILLLLYVIVVGPLNFSWVARKNRPTLALITTPIAAFVCLALLLGVGYVGKGTTMRYRAVGLLELVEGEPSGPERRYLGLFLTRPATFDLAVPERGTTSLVHGVGARGLKVASYGERSIVEDLQGGLWETLFLREDRLSGLGGAVTLEREGGHLVAVRNESRVTLRGAVVLDMSGNAYVVGDVAPGARVEIARAPSEALGSTEPMFWSEHDPKVARVARLLGVPADQSGAVYGVAQLMGGSLVGPWPALYAQIDPESEAPLADRFVRERELRFVRVVPYLARSQSAGRAPDGPEEEAAAMVDQPLGLDELELQRVGPIGGAP